MEVPSSRRAISVRHCFSWSPDSVRRGRRPARTSSSSSPTTWAGATSAATARRRSARRASIGSPPRGCGSPRPTPGTPCAPVALLPDDRQAPRATPTSATTGSGSRTSSGPGRSRSRRTTVTLPKLFKAQGYATGAMGKWGLGSPENTGDPVKHGFDLLLRLLLPGPRPQPLPEYVWRNGEKVDARRQRRLDDRQAVHARPVRGRGPEVRPRAQGQAVLPVPAVHRPAPGLPGAGRLAGRVQGQVRRRRRTGASSTSRTTPRGPPTPPWSRAWTAPSAA